MKFEIKYYGCTNHDNTFCFDTFSNGRCVFHCLEINQTLIVKDNEDKVLKELSLNWQTGGGLYDGDIQNPTNDLYLDVEAGNARWIYEMCNIDNFDADTMDQLIEDIEEEDGLKLTSSDVMGLNLMIAENKPEIQDYLEQFGLPEDWENPELFED